MKISNNHRALLNKSDIEELTMTYFRDTAKVKGGYEELMKVDSMWDRVRDAQAQQMLRYFLSILAKARKRANKNKSAYSGKTMKTAKKISYWEGVSDEIVLLEDKLKKILKEVEGESKQVQTIAQST